jgi:hypothetical protein
VTTARGDGLVGCDFKPVGIWRLILGDGWHATMFSLCSKVSSPFSQNHHVWIVWISHEPGLD